MQLKTANGWLTEYALACGYVECATDGDMKVMRMWHEGGPLIHIRGHDHDTGQRLFWDVAETMSEARRVFRKRAKEYGMQRVH